MCESALCLNGFQSSLAFSADFFSFMYAFSMALLSLLLSVDGMVTAFLFPFPVGEVAGHQLLPGAEQAEISLHLSAERWRAGTGSFFNPLHLKLLCESCAVSEDQLFTVFLVQLTA